MFLTPPNQHSPRIPVAQVHNAPFGNAGIPPHPSEVTRPLHCTSHQSPYTSHQAHKDTQPFEDLIVDDHVVIFANVAFSDRIMSFPIPKPLE